MRFYLFLAILLIGHGLTAQGEQLQVVASASIFADMAREIGGDAVEVKSIVPIGGDPHLHEPTPADAILVNSADLILRNGLTFEGWLNELIENSGTAAEVVTITRGIQPIESLDYENATDPHAWMDASLGLIYLRNIKNALVRLDPANRDMYETNYEVYRRQIRDLDDRIRTQMATIPEASRVLVTSHDAFQYFGRRYGLDLEAVLGVSTDADVQTSDIARLTETLRARPVPAIFIESTINPKLLEQIAADNDVCIGGSLFADSLGDAESPAPTYYDMLKHNAETIVAALTRATGDCETEVDPGTYWTNIILYTVLGLLLVGGFLYVAFNITD